MIELKSIPMTSDKGEIESARFFEHGCFGLATSTANRYEGKEAEVLVPPDIGVPESAVSGAWLICSLPSEATWVEFDGGARGGRTR